jgi:hypothetical protein
VPLPRGPRCHGGCPRGHRKRFILTGCRHHCRQLSDTLGLASADYALQLTNPSMLGDIARWVFSVGLLVVAGGAAWLLGQADGGSVLSTDEAISLGVLGRVALLALLILVMGYKDVIAKGTRGAGATTSSSTTGNKGSGQRTVHLLRPRRSDDLGAGVISARVVSMNTLMASSKAVLKGRVDMSFHGKKPG